jgi:hypothetical protein
LSIILAMPGKREHQERFWQKCILETGLEFYTQLAFQANAAWHDEYPADLLARYDDPKRIAQDQHKHTLPRFASEYQPKPFAYTFLDYEPDKPLERGPESAWQWLKIVEGFNDADTDALAQMRRGVQEATGGLPYSIYRTPTLPREGAVEPFVVKSAREITDGCEWVWMHAYPHGEITQDNIGEWADKLKHDFGALSKLGRRVIPWIWPAYTMTTREALIYGAATIRALRDTPGIEHIGVWVDCNHANATEIQVRNFVAIAAYLREFMEK